MLIVWPFAEVTTPMNSSRWFFAFVSIVIAFRAQAPARGQDDEKDKQAILTKKKTIELLDKANEEYRVFFKRPEKTIEYWSAIKFEMELGKFDLAALHLKRMLGNDPAIKTDAADEIDKDLVKFEQAEGMSAFLRLRLVKPIDWSDHPPFRTEALANVEGLIDRVTKAVEKHLSDPDRIKKYIARLDAPTPEERGYAYVQIARSRERAVPYLIEELRKSFGKPLHGRVRETLLRMGPETVSVYLEVFKAVNEKDYRDIELRLTLLEIFRQRDDKRVIPYLWHMSAAKQYPAGVRDRAKEVLASLLRLPIDELPPSKETLTYEAERYYQHNVKFKEDKDVLVWEWNGEALALAPTGLSPSRAEEFFGMRYAREALDLDPAYQPAQVVFLSLMLDRHYRPKVDQILTEAISPRMHQLLTSLDADLALRVLERGMEDRQLPVILPLIMALGERAEFRAARLNPSGQPRGIVKALYYPDRRVQFAAMKAMLRMPPTTRPAVEAERIVELSRRFLASEATSKSLVVHAPLGDEQAIRKTVGALGFEPVLASKVQEAVKKGTASADFDLIILHKGMANADFPHVYGQLRQHFDLGGLPMIVVVDKAREKVVKQMIASNPNAIVITEDKFKADDEFKSLAATHVKNVQLAKLTPDERMLFAKTALDTFWSISQGDLQGYDIAPAFDVILEQLKSNEKNATTAIKILGRLPGSSRLSVNTIQNKLAGIAGDPARDIKLREPALQELNRHMQKNGVTVGKKLQDDLRQAHQIAAPGQPFHNQLVIAIGMFSRTTAAKTGADLIKFRPDDPPAPKEKEKKVD
ncbi:MAG: hypothetical protein EXR98_00140 [Gemmataceae bacterium]|nr:hypothetical protein [Gemmataceae bacterium]